MAFGGPAVFHCGMCCWWVVCVLFLRLGGGCWLLQLVEGYLVGEGLYLFWQGEDGGLAWLMDHSVLCDVSCRVQRVLEVLTVGH